MPDNQESTKEDKENSDIYIRGLNIGPYDVSEVDNSIFSSLNNPEVKSYKPQHSLNQESTLWTRSMTMQIPQGCQVFEMHEDDIVAGLIIVVPETTHRKGYSLTVSIFAAPKIYEDDDYEIDLAEGIELAWGKNAREEIINHFHISNIPVEEKETIWGTKSISAQAYFDDGSTGQTVEVYGCRGPRWIMRATCSTHNYSEAIYKEVIDSLSSIIVFRGNNPYGPGHPLDISLVNQEVKA